MSIHNVLPAKRIADVWPATVGKLPQPLADVVAAFEEVDYTVPPAATLTTAGLTAKDIPAAVEKLAGAIAVRDSFEEAKRQAKGDLADAVLLAASQAVPAIAKSLAPTFQTAVQTYRSAVNMLPEQISSEILVGSDPAVLAAFQNAVAAAAAIKAIDGWLASTFDLPEHGAFEHQPALRVLNPQTRAELTVLLNAKAKSDIENQLNAVYLTAVREGIPFAMHTCHEAQALRDSIDSMPVVRKPIKFARLAR